MQALSRLCDLDLTVVLARAGIPKDQLTLQSDGVSADEAFAFWTALYELSDSPALSIELAKKAAHIQIVPALMAFLFSKDVRSGLEQLAIYKRVTGPYELTIADDPAGLRITVACSVPGLAMPAGLPTFELVYMMELLRTSTAHNLVALSVTLPEIIVKPAEVAQTFGVWPKYGPDTEMVISHESASKTLITANLGLWRAFEDALKSDLLHVSKSSQTQKQVHEALLKLLPLGKSSIADIANHLSQTPRSLQRLLKAENTTFAVVLDDLRQGLAFKYLAQPEISIKEVSTLLGYRDPNSFHRAFRNWTGLTPTQARRQNHRE